MSTISPQLFPTNGLRNLTAKELMQRAKALNCTVAKSTKPSCSSQLNIGMFFDGTGNNMNADFDSLPVQSRKHSNVVKLFNCFPQDIANGYFRFYMPGVGTPFPEIESKFNYLGHYLGGPFAWDGENRIIWALIRLFNAVHTFVYGTPFLNDMASRTFSNMMSEITFSGSERRNKLIGWQETLKKSISSRKPEIEIINLSVFGFSRGAAEARAFCNWLIEVCGYKEGAWIFAGIPIRIGFLGIFDTVASVGIPNSLPNSIAEGHQSWADGSMEINPAIEQCVHFVAGHEVRAAFPLDSVRVHKTYPANAKEVMYPGAHSDLGGGYAPNAVGISPDIKDMYAVIPGADMYHETRRAGVPLKSWDELRESQKQDFIPSLETIKSFNSYLKSANISSGPVEQMHRRHMSLYLSYRYKYRNRLEQLPFYKRADRENKNYIEITSGTFQKRLLKKFTAYPVHPSDSEYSLVDAVKLQKAFAIASGLHAQDKTDGELQQLYDVASAIDFNSLTPEIEDFFGNCIHDSMAGFIAMGGKATNELLINNLGIMRFRKIFTKNG